MAIWPGGLVSNTTRGKTETYRKTGWIIFETPFRVFLVQTWLFIASRPHYTWLARMCRQYKILCLCIRSAGWDRKTLGYRRCLKYTPRSVSHNGVEPWERRFTYSINATLLMLPNNDVDCRLSNSSLCGRLRGFRTSDRLFIYPRNAAEYWRSACPQETSTTVTDSSRSRQTVSFHVLFRRRLYSGDLREYERSWAHYGIV